MLFQNENQKRDLEWGWHRGDRAFFQAGACHILADAFLRKFPQAGFRPVMILTDQGFRGGHIVAASPELIFDWHGFSRRERYLDHHFGKMRRFFPGWNASVIELDDFMTPSFFQKFNHRSPDQYFRNPTLRAEAFVSRLVSRNPAFAQ
jgi:hypothetical protein